MFLKRKWLFLTAITLLFSNIALAEGEKNFLYQAGSVTAEQQVPDNIPSYAALWESTNPYVDGVFYADYIISYEVKDGRYAFKTAEIKNVSFSGTTWGQFLDNKIDADCNMSREGQVTITFSYQLKGKEYHGDTVYLEPMTTVTTFQLPGK